MFNEKAKKWGKYLALIGAVATGLASIVGGDILTGVGVIAAALSGPTVGNAAATRPEASIG